MTDQTKQRMVELMEFLDPGSVVLMDEFRCDVYEFLGASKSSHLEKILAWSDRQSAASAAAALRWAAYKIKYAEQVEHALINDCCEQSLRLARQSIETLITPAGTSALASMLEEAERSSRAVGAVSAVKMVEAGMIEPDLATHDARVRNEVLEEVATEFGCRHDSSYRGSTVAKMIRALKSKEQAMGDLTKALWKFLRRAFDLVGLNSASIWAHHRFMDAKYGATLSQAEQKGEAP